MQLYNVAVELLLGRKNLGAGDAGEEDKREEDQGKVYYHVLLHHKEVLHLLPFFQALLQALPLLQERMGQPRTGMSADMPGLLFLLPSSGFCSYSSSTIVWTVLITLPGGGGEEGRRSGRAGL